MREITIASDLVSMLQAVRAVGSEARWVPFGGSVKARAAAGRRDGGFGRLSPERLRPIERARFPLQSGIGASVVRRRCYVRARFSCPRQGGERDEVRIRRSGRGPQSGLSKGDAAEAVDAVLETIEEVLKRGGEINFTGFGKFSVADRGARQGVNPQTGERIQIAASRVPRFSAGSALKKAVKGG